MKHSKQILSMFTTIVGALFVFGGSIFAAPYSQLSIQDIEVKTTEDLRVNFVFPDTESTIDRLAVTVWEGQRSGILWSGVISDWDEEIVLDARSVSFKVETVEPALEGVLDVQVAVFDEFSNIIAQGKQKAEASPKTSLPKAEWRDFSLEEDGFALKYGDGFGIDIMVEGDIRSQYLSGESQGVFRIEAVEQGKDGNLHFEKTFEALDPGKYYLLLRLKSMDGGILTSWSHHEFVREGDILLFYGETPDPTQNIEENQTAIPLQIEGYVPPGKPYKILLNVEQRDPSRQSIKEASEILEEEILVESHQRFTLDKTIELHEEAEIIQIDMELISSIEGERGIEKQLTYRRPLDFYGGAEQEILEEKPVEVEPARPVQVVEQRSNPQQSLVWWQWATIILAGAVVALMGLFLKTRRHLKGFIIFLVFGLGASSVFAAEVPDYTGVIQAPSTTIALNPDSGASGFNTLSFQVKVNNDNPGSQDHLLERTDIALESVQALYRAAGGGGYTSISPLIDHEDVFLSESDPGVSGYDMLQADIDLSALVLTDGGYDIQVIFTFDDSNTLTSTLDDYFYVDKVDPSVIVTPLTANPLSYKDYIIGCGSGESLLGCVVPTSTNSTIRVQGNFCDGVDDTGKLCDITALKRTFEVCDAAGNCSGEINPLGDFFHYDGFPPELDEISGDEVELIIGANAEGTGYDGEGGDDNVKAQTQFRFNLRDDKDDTVDPLDYPDAAGPNADPNMCGEKDYNDDCRDYDNSGDPATCASVTNLSPFYSGQDPDDGGSNTLCRQRNIICSNSPGHRGVWDRSTGSTDIFRCYEEPTVAPVASACDPGYSFDDNGTPGNTGDDSCKKTCGEGYYDNGGACSPVLQCDPTVASRLSSIPGVWINETGPATKSNEDMVFDEDANDATTSNTTNGYACSWGCGLGYVPDDELNPTTCVLFEPTTVTNLLSWVYVDTDRFTDGSGTPKAMVDGTIIEDDDRLVVEGAIGGYYEASAESSGDLVYRADPLSTGHDMVEILDTGSGFSDPLSTFQVSNSATSGWTVYYVAKMTGVADDELRRAINSENPTNGSFGFVSCNSGSNKGPRYDGVYLKGGKPSAECSSPAKEDVAGELFDLRMYGGIVYPGGSFDFRDSSGSIQTWPAGTVDYESYDWTINQGKFPATKTGSKFYVGELIIYDHAVSDTDRDDLEAYLKAKWGL